MMPTEEQIVKAFDVPQTFVQSILIDLAAAHNKIAHKKNQNRRKKLPKN
jgi:hypothetical protein